MKIAHSSPIRQIVAALVIAVLTLAGAGRGMAAGPHAVDAVADRAFQTIPGVVTPICHVHTGDGSPPADPVRHDCCDACVLGGSAIVVAGPALPRVTPASHALVRSALVAWTVRLGRVRSPRQSQGPPSRVT